MTDRTSYYGAPLIVPTEDSTTAKANQPFTLFCHSATNITWVVIDPHSDRIDATGLDIRYQVNESSNLIYEAALIFSAVSVYDVKYYYCIKEQYLTLAETAEDLRNEEHNFHATKTYLFVEGRMDLNVKLVRG